MRPSSPNLALVHILVGVCVVACAQNRAMQATTPLQGGEVSAAAITGVAMERRCFGCDRELKITLRRDGTAAKTMFGNARSGTTDRLFTSAVPLDVFTGLARTVVAEGFFQLLDEYRDPKTADGQSIVTTVTAGARQKSVAERDDIAPALLHRIQARIEEVANGLSWKESR